MERDSIYSKAGKALFVVELIAVVQAEIISKIDRMPEDWDGHELRRFIADKFEECTSFPKHGGKEHVRRAREYRNTVLVNGL